MARGRSTEETRRSEIIDASLRLILKQGFHSTTLDQVAAEAGVSKGLVSYYFSKKEELFLAVLEQMVDRLRGDLEDCYRADAPARERLRMNFMNLFGNDKRTRQYYTVVIDFLGEALREKTVRVYTHIIYDTVLTYIEWTVTDGIRAGEFRRVDAKETASLIVATMEGLVLQWLFSDDEIDLDGAFRICESLADRLLEGSPSVAADTARAVETK